MNDAFKDMGRNIDSIAVSVIKSLEKELKSYLDKCGLFYKVFSRIKSSKSVYDKLDNRAKKGIQNYKMQDLIGIRIVLYFKSDIKLCEKLINQHFNVLDISKDEELTDKFCPQRINYVCSLPEDVVNEFDPIIWTYPIDKSFEVQIRTIFSEGWHEIEHDFRYKCLSDWDKNEDLSRTLNGIFATLDNCDWTILSLLTEVAYILNIRELSFSGVDGYDKRPDFILVDVNGFIDIMEIKKPTVNILTKQASYRNNYKTLGSDHLINE